MRWNLLPCLTLSSLAAILAMRPGELIAAGLPVETTFESHSFQMGLTPQSSTKALPQRLPKEQYPPVPVSDSASEGGADRGCGPRGAQYTPIALAPELYGSGGYTQSAQPLLWFYLPFEITTDPAAAQTIQLKMERQVVTEETAGESAEPVFEFESVFRRAMSAPALQPGLVAIALADIDISLPINETFRWTVEIHCGDPGDLINSFRPFYTQGWISRLNPTDLATPLATPEPMQNAAPVLSAAYRDSGLWYDALNVLGAEMLQPIASEDPEAVAAMSELHSAWQQLLIEGGFGNIANETAVQVLNLSVQEPAL